MAGEVLLRFVIGRRTVRRWGGTHNPPPATSPFRASPAFNKTNAGLSPAGSIFFTGVPVFPKGTGMNLKVIDDTIFSEEERLESLMQRRLGNRIRGLRIHLQPQGALRLGRTAPYHANHLAQHAAMELANMPILANDI